MRTESIYMVTTTENRLFSIYRYSQPENLPEQPTSLPSLRRRVIGGIQEKEVPITIAGRLPVQLPGLTTGDVWFVSPLIPINSSAELHGFTSLLIDENITPFRRQSARVDGHVITPEKLTYEEEIAEYKNGEGLIFRYPDDGEIRWKVGMLLEKSPRPPDGTPIVQSTDVAIFASSKSATEALGHVRSAIQAGKTSVYDIEPFFVYNKPII